jgi:flavorubredoxin
MDAAIIYESMTGTTQRAAHLIGDAFYDAQIDARIYPTAAATAEAIAAADLVIVGTWTDGALIVGQKPAKHKKLAKLPDLTGKRCLVYCTYAIAPGKTIEKLTAIVEKLGGEVLGGMTLRRDHLVEDASAFAERAIAAVVS